jgi:hypothetical protein
VHGSLLCVHGGDLYRAGTDTSPSAIAGRYSIYPAFEYVADGLPNG